MWEKFKSLKSLGRDEDLNYDLRDPLLQNNWIDVFFLLWNEHEPSKVELQIIAKLINSFKKIIDGEGKLIGFATREKTGYRSTIMPSRVEAPFPYTRDITSPSGSVSIYRLSRLFKTHTVSAEEKERLHAKCKGIKFTAVPPYNPIDLVFDLPVLQMIGLSLRELLKVPEPPLKKSLNYIYFKGESPSIDKINDLLVLRYKIEDRSYFSNKYKKADEFIFERSLNDEIKIARNQIEKRKQPSSDVVWLESVDELMKKSTG